MAGEADLITTGNLVADPEPRVSQAGNPWVTFRIANTPRIRDKQSGNYEDGEALWLGCRAYGELADHIASSLHKGDRVLVQGKLTQRSYTDNQGAQRVSMELEVTEIGASLRFADVQITRQQRASAGSQPGWGAPAAQQSSGFGNAPQNADSVSGFGNGFDGEEAF